MLSTMIFIVSLFNLNLADSNLAIGFRITELRILPKQYVIQKRTGNTLITYGLNISTDIHLPSIGKTIDSLYVDDSTHSSRMWDTTQSSYGLYLGLNYTRYKMKRLKDWGNGVTLSFMSGITRYIVFEPTYESTRIKDSALVTKTTHFEMDVNAGVGLNAGLQLSKELWGHQFYLNFITSLVGFRAGIDYSRRERINKTASGTYLNISSSTQPYFRFDYYGGPMTGLFAIYLLVEL